MSWLARLGNVFRRKRLDAEIDEELQVHVEMRAADLERSGMAAADARVEAERLLGNAAALRDRTRDADVWVLLETTMQDVRYGLRWLWRAPLFTLAAVLTLALGIGANTAMFGVLYGVLIRPLPYADAERLYMLFQTNARAGGRTRAAPLDFLDWQQRSRAFTMAGVAGTGFTLTGTGDPELVVGQLVTGDFFSILGVQPALGRPLTAADQESGDAIVLSHGLWQRRYAGDPGVLGTTITANGRPFTVVGVMPPAFAFLSPRYQLWVPFPVTGRNPDNLPLNRNSRYVQVIAKLHPGVSPSAAQQDLAAIATILGREYPDSFGNSGISMSSLTEETVGDVRPALKLLFLAVTLLLVMACGNVTSLMLARVTVREPEILVRAALGASRSRMVRQFLTETLVLYAAGTAAGLLVATWLLNVVRALGTNAIPRLDDVGVMTPVLLFACATALVAALIFGVGPAWQATRSSAARLASRTSTSAGRHRRFRSAIVVAQVALALCLLTGAALVSRSLLNLQRVDKGFDPAGRLTFSIVMPAARFTTAESMHAFYRRLLDALVAQPDFASVGLTTHLPLSGQDLENGFAVDGYVPPSPELEPVAALRGISPEYVSAMGIPVRAGRTFASTDDERAAPVAMVNEAFVRRYFGGRDPIGRRISVGDASGPWRTIVGVVADVKHRGLAADARPEALLPYVQLDAGFLVAWARGVSVVVRAETDFAAAAGSIRQRVRQLDPNLPVIELRPMDELVSDAVAQPRFRTFVLGSFAIVAVLLAAVGLFGVLSYLVSERTREIGIRMALGAHPGTIFRDVLTQGVRLVAAGTVIGLAGGALLTRWIAGLLFDVQPGDPAAIGAAAALLALIALVAAFVPARRATRVSPVIALRS